MKNTQHDSKNGFTLLELLIGLLLATIAFLGIASLQSHGISMMRSAREQMHATTVLEYVMDELHTAPWENIQSRKVHVWKDIHPGEHGDAYVAPIDLEILPNAMIGIFLSAENSMAEQAEVSLIWTSHTGHRKTNVTMSIISEPSVLR